MKELKELIIKSIVEDGYSYEEAKDSVNKAVITVEGDIITVEYQGGVIDKFKIETIIKETLIQIS